MGEADMVKEGVDCRKAIADIGPDAWPAGLFQLAPPKGNHTSYGIPNSEGRRDRVREGLAAEPDLTPVFSSTWS